MLFVPVGYTFGAGMFKMDSIRGGSPYGAGVFAGDGTREPSDIELALAEHQGKYMAGVVKRLAQPWFPIGRVFVTDVLHHLQCICPVHHFNSLFSTHSLLHNTRIQGVFFPLFFYFLHLCSLYIVSSVFMDLHWCTCFKHITLLLFRWWSDNKMSKFCRKMFLWKSSIFGFSLIALGFSLLWNDKQ